MEQAIRNKLRSVVTQCRKLLEEAIAQMLEGQFGIDGGGTRGVVHVEEPSRMSHLSEEDRDYRHDILDHFDHIQALGYPPKGALDQLIREIAFTHLNRLCAYKMMEARKVWIGGQRFREAVSRGQKSQGFMFYLADHPEDEQCFRNGQQDVAYRHFLDWLGDTLSEEIGVLFNPTDPANQLYPPQRILDDVLERINSEELAEIWTEDETIGWVYQYFTPKELRDRVRKESAAPRNSYELAFRNQFFTPRYVVEFLTDNTLGRIWYEMRKGDTSLTDQCRYLVRRPNEIFLEEGQSVPQEAKENPSDLSQEALLKQPVYIPHRPKKDPRDLKILDPACGSGHFLLYGFDLLLTIYEEAYDDPDLGPVLRQDYPSLDELRRHVPSLILSRNLHGIDIDLRATQIASLALWLRCQRMYQEFGLQKSCPKITRSNIVCAEPMPGEKELLERFVTGLQPKVLGQLIMAVFESMKLAGEAGSLLKIEEEIAHAVSEAKQQWRDRPKEEQLTLWAEEKRPKAVQLGLFDVSGITDEEFWHEAEARVCDALHEYARQATNGVRLQKQLFAEDVTHGFAFVDLCRRRFDVVLMNPPFSDASVPSKAYIEENFCDTKGDVYKAFVECFQDRLVPRGLLGIISSRTGFFLRNSSDWRERILLRLYRPLLLADFGDGVLEAMVETAAYVLQTISVEEDRNLTLDILPNLLKIPSDKKGTFSIPKYQTHRGGLKRHQAIQELRRLLDAGYVTEVPGNYTRFMAIKNSIEQAPAPCSAQYPALYCFRLLEDREKEHALHDVLHNPQDSRYFVTSPQAFQNVPGTPFSYWVSERIRRLFTELPRFESDGRTVKQGLATADDFRFVRAWWEVPPEYILDSANGPDHQEDLPAFQAWCRRRTFEGKRWVPFAKGGAYSPYYADLYLVVNWERDGEEIRDFVNPTTGRPYSRPQNTDFYFRPGLTWPRRTQKGLNLRNLPAGCVFADKGPVAFDTAMTLLPLLAMTSSGAFSQLVQAQMAFGSYEVGVIQRTPIPNFTKIDGQQLGELAHSVISFKRSLDTIDETSHIFVVPALLQISGAKLSKRNDIWAKRVSETEEKIIRLQQHISETAYRFYGIDQKDQPVVQPSVDIEATTEDEEEESSKEQRALATDIRSQVTDLVSYIFGTALGRWDIRYATNQRSHLELLTPFSPLPICAPGMLVDQVSLPLRETPPEYPLSIDWDGILVDDPDHQDDIIRCIRDVLELIWQERSESIEKEICQILGCKEFRDYFRKPANGGFWQDHVKRYFKKPRKAPIYWLLQSQKKSYALWLYYHRLDKDILFKALVNYVEPKIRLEEIRLEALRAQRAAGGSSGRGVKQLEKDIHRQEELLSELQDFEEKLRRVANLHLDPDLNDGVVLNIAPLHELVPWKEAQKYWDELVDGKYEWSSIGKQLREKGIVHGS